MDDPQESANERRHEQVEAVQEILDSADPALEEHAYPVSSEELAAHYGSTDVELPNETESLGSVFDRLADQEFDSPMAVKEEVLRAASDASPEPPNAGDGRSPEADHGGTPESVLDDLESETVAESTREENPTEVEPTSGGVGTAADAISGPETDVAGPGDELTPDTTEDDEFAPQDTLADSDREGDRRAGDERSSDRGDPWEAAEEEPGDPAEPTAEPAESDRDPEERLDDLPDAPNEADAAKPSERARRDGEDEESPAGTSADGLREGPVPDARDEESDVSREGNVPDDEGDSEGKS